MTRGVLRICPYCGKLGMTLWFGGYGGAVYKCPNCEYVGPIVLEYDPKEMSEEARKLTDVAMSSVNNTLNRLGLFSGLVFVVIGLVVGARPFPVGGNYVATFGIALLWVGGLVILVSVVSWFIGHVRKDLSGKSA